MQACETDVYREAVQCNDSFLSGYDNILRHLQIQMPLQISREVNHNTAVTRFGYNGWKFNLAQNQITGFVQLEGFMQVNNRHLLLLALKARLIFTDKKDKDETLEGNFGSINGDAIHVEGIRPLLGQKQKKWKWVSDLKPGNRNAVMQRWTALQPIPYTIYWARGNRKM